MIIIEKPKMEDVLGIQKVFYETWLATYPNKESGILVEDIEEKYKDAFSEKSIKKNQNLF